MRRYKVDQPQGYGHYNIYTPARETLADKTDRIEMNAKCWRERWLILYANGEVRREPAVVRGAMDLLSSSRELP